VKTRIFHLLRWYAKISRALSFFLACTIEGSIQHGFLEANHPLYVFDSHQLWSFVHLSNQLSEPCFPTIREIFDFSTRPPGSSSRQQIKSKRDWLRF
jgi:hypothetical protein